MQYFHNNLLAVNAKKTSACDGYIKNNNSNDNTMIGGKIFTSIYKTKFLGIIIDEN